MAMNSPTEFRAKKIEELLSSANLPASTSPCSPRQAGPVGADCSADEYWLKVSAHELDGDEAQRLIDHAARCQFCGPKLHYWASVLAEEESPEETLLLSQLSVSKSGWQERMAKMLMRKSREKNELVPKRRFFFPLALGFAGALAAAVIVVLLIRDFHSAPSPERLLAEAYTNQRIMDTRIPLAAYAPVSPPHHQRAAGTNSMSDSVPLLEARAAITQALMKTPEDTHLLLLQARSDLLSEDYTTAIDTLKRLVALNSSNVAALTDLASAYSMRAKATDVVSDEATALDYLEKAAHLDPKNPVILYNEAVILQSLGQFNSAIEVWNKFLAVENNKSWVQDGKRRLSEAEKHVTQLKQDQSELDPFLGNAEGMFHLARSPDLLANYDEELSTLHLPLLLKSAFPAQSASSSRQVSSSPLQSPVPCDAFCNAARTLLAAIAASLEAHHQDRWLADFLHAKPDAAFVTGANLLADAVDGSLKADDAAALREATAAAPYFHSAGNTAGELRAGVERIHAYQRLLDGAPCLADAARLEPALDQKRYPWIAVEFWADRSGCYTDVSDFANDRASMDRSLRLAEAAQYRIASIRVQSFLASEEDSLGDHDEAWALDIDGIRKFWAGHYPAMRGYQFYSNLTYAETETARVYSSVLIHKETLNFISQLHQPSTEIADRFLLVKAEIRAGEMQDAAAQLRIAEAEFAALPSHEAFRRSAAECHIYLAQAYLAASDTAAAAAMLTDASKFLDGDSDSYLQLRYSEALGHLALLRNDRSQAEAHLTQAVATAEESYKQIRGLRDRVDWIRQARETYAALTLLRLREGANPIEALSIWERYRVLSAGASLSRWCHSEELACLAAPLASAQQALHDETVLGSIRLDRSLLLWSMDDRGLHTQELGIDPARFDLLGRAFSETVATPQSSEASVLFYGSRLSDTLLLPLSSSLDPRRTLVFDLDDSMEFLPVAALPLNPAYLGTRFSVSATHSLLESVTDSDQRLRPIALVSPSLVIGASIPGDPDATPLPEAKTEALAVAAQLAHPTVLTGDRATAAAVRNALSHSTLIHFAGHTISYAGNTRLLLARSPSAPRQSAWFDAGSIPSSTFSGCRLVVLSACSTGKREERDFDDTDSIVQSLAGAGVPDIIATHWDVDSAAAVHLMQSFYSSLAQGLTAPQALSRAEETLEKSTEYHHPFYWAAYYSVGIGRTKYRELVHE